MTSDRLRCPSYVDSGVRALWGLCRSKGLYGIDHGALSLHMELGSDPCNCGYDIVVQGWWRGHPHAPDCCMENYHAIPVGTVFTNKEAIRALAERFRRAFIDGLGFACSCGRLDECKEFFKSKWHNVNCRALSPLFVYKDIKVEGEVISKEVPPDKWYDVMTACISIISGGKKSRA